MKLIPRRTRPLPERAPLGAAAAAGAARLAIKQRTLHPHLMQLKRRGLASRLLHRG
jgi:hypothetical protein